MGDKNTEAKRRQRRRYNATPAAKKQRAENNKARRMMIKAGRAKKGDGKDVAHKDNNTKHNTLSNLSLQSKKKNRSFARTSTSKRKRK